MFRIELNYDLDGQELQICNYSRNFTSISGFFLVIL